MSAFHSELANPRATRAVLDDHGLSLKHKLGQNFLIDDNIIAKIGELAELKPLESADAHEAPCVLEIGPGIGTLTVALLACANVISIERDEDLLPVLAQTTARDSERFVLLHKDALKITRADIETSCDQLDCNLPTMLVANLPYQVAATVVLDWFERFEFIERMVVMVQSEVADRMAASCGTKAYGAYSIKLALHAATTGRVSVPPSCFMPAPHIDSAVVRLQRKTDAATPEAIKAACTVADAAFSMRRKTIRNAMKSKLGANVTDAILERCDIAPTVRGETLPPETYLQMGAVFSEL